MMMYSFQTVPSGNYGMNYLMIKQETIPEENISGLFRQAGRV
jgi:hypothetical protein